MNVLYYLKNYPKLSQSFVLNEVSELERRGHNVAVFSRRNPAEDVQHEEYAELDVPVRYAVQPTMTDAPDLLTTKLLNRRVLRRSLYRTHLKDHAKYLQLVRQCIEFVNELGWSIDHVHSHFAHPNKLPATYVAGYYEVPCTVTAHAYEIFRDPDVRMLRVLFDRMDRILVPSRYNRSYLRERFEIETPIDVVPATTRMSKYQPSDREVRGRVLTVARLVEKKGVEFAVEAVARLVETHPEIDYHIVGTGERETMLRQRVADLGIEDHVTFLGHVSDDRLHQEFDEAAVFVLPSVVTDDGDRDSSPVALKEAMAMATPCISTTVAGIPEIIKEGSDGVLVEPRDTDGLTEALAAILTNKASRKEMGDHARRTIREEFSLEVAVDALLSSFQRVNSQR